MTSSAPHRTTADNSKERKRFSGGGRGSARLTGLLAAVAALGAAALLLATVLPVLQVEASTAVPDDFSQSGWERHGPLLLAAALVGAIMITPARKGNRRAALMLTACGLLALLIALISDVPEIGSSGLLPGSLSEGFVTAGVGAYAEVLGAILMLLGGGLLSFLSLER